MKFSSWVKIILLSLIVGACASKSLKYDKSAQLVKNDEFDKAIQIERTEPASADDDEEDADGKTSETAKESTTNSTAPGTVTPAAAPSAESSAKSKTQHSEKKSEKKAEKKTESTAVKTPSTKKSKKSSKVAAVEATPAEPTRRQPDLEDDAGFSGRRPVQDPFRVGESVTHDVHYFKVSAGTLKLKVAPMVNVNGRKAYNFVTEVKSSSMFSSVYSVDDKVDNFVDFETLVPRVFTLHVKETSQLREARMIFDEKSLKATYWEKKVTEKNGEEEKKQSWEILPYSQNVFSAAFYMRNFQWEVGKEVSFRVADDEQNLVFKAKCLRKEVLDTALGPMKALVLKPEVTLKGAFKPVGDIYIWLSDDEHKYVLRIESKIKIGTIISEVIAIKPGRN